jgi:hypothetical protein
MPNECFTISCTIEEKIDAANEDTISQSPAKIRQKKFAEFKEDPDLAQNIPNSILTPQESLRLARRNICAQTVTFRITIKPKQKDTASPCCTCKVDLRRHEDRFNSISLLSIREFDIDYDTCAAYLKSLTNQPLVYSDKKALLRDYIKAQIILFICNELKQAGYTHIDCEESRDICAWCLTNAGFVTTENNCEELELMLASCSLYEKNLDQLRELPTSAPTSPQE